MAMHVEFELRICAECLVLIANGDGSADPEDAERRTDSAVARWGSLAGQVSISCCGDCDHGYSLFDCGYCGDESFGERHEGVILAPGRKCKGECLSVR